MNNFHNQLNNSPQKTTKSSTLAISIATIMALAQPTAWAAFEEEEQAEESQKSHRVEITGSAIKRIENETPLPIQIISREQIEKIGLTTASEIMSRVTANSGGLTDGASINVGGDQRGFNSANLRGIGTSSTLVLLNGRRMANFASPGDDSGVDLNNIPAAAIQRVEILLDGASSLYGTDAIGGVINFITRKDFSGVELGGYLNNTDEGGAGKKTVTLSAGFGEIAKHGFNIFGVADFQKTDSLNTSQRAFIPNLHIPERLGHLLSNFTSPANIRLTSAQRNHLQSIGYTINGQPIVNRQINLSAPACAPPANPFLPNGTGGVNACTYDYMRDTELFPKSEKINLLSRAVFEINPSHQIFAEVALSRSVTTYVGSSARVTGYIDYKKIPQLAGTGLDLLDEDDAGEITLRMRLNEAGKRTSELTSESQRYVIGLSGTVGNWDYDVGVNHSVSSIKDKDVHGYLLYDQLLEGIADGRINPFGPSSPEGVALINSIQVNDVVRRARGTMNSLDFKVARDVMPLSGGNLALALGGELRSEQSEFTPSALLMSDNINNDAAPEGGKSTNYKRNIVAIFGELEIPITKQWQAQLSARYDHYQVIGGAASPKLGVSYMPNKQLLWRASIGRGFRAPSMNDMYRPTVYSSTATLPDPVYCATVNNNYADCADNWDTRRYSNPNLKPEYSRQFSFGNVFSSSKFTLKTDYWNIKRTNLISEIGDDVILGNLEKYGHLVHRNADNDIDYIDLIKENRGAEAASGIDFNLELHPVHTTFGKLGAQINATFMLQSKIQTSPGDAYISNLNQFVTDGVAQRWRHSITVDWSKGDFSASLSNTFSSSYRDQNSAINIDDGSVVKENRVKAYSIWDLSGTYLYSPTLKIRAGIQNLFNTSPPFSNQAAYFLSGYDPTYTDPRGRRYFLSANYTF